MFEGADRPMAVLTMTTLVDDQYVCARCGGDKRKGPFSYMGRQWIVGCCRASVAEKAGVSPEQVNVCQSFISD